MSPATAALLGAVIALLVVSIGAVLTRSARRPPPAPLAAPRPSTLPDGLTQALGALREGGIVVGPTDDVLLASAPSETIGLVRSGELMHPELRTLVRRVRVDGVVRERELELARGPIGAGRVLVGVRVALVRPDLVLVLVEDRTQARRVEEVRRDFVVNVSHELKTPVGGLALLAEAIEDAADDPAAVARFAHRITLEAHRLARLVNEIVDLSRLQTVDVTAEPVLVDVSACADEAVEHSRLVARDRRLTTHALRREDGMLRVYGDHELVTTAVRNLVTNAIAYSDDGSRVSVVTRRTAGWVEVAVSDQGHGISLPDQQRIFERFYRVDAARSRATGGTGLGLSIVKHVCANHGGDVVVWSQEGHGSTFTIRLPAAVDDERPLGSPAPAGRSTPDTHPELASPAPSASPPEVDP